MGHVSNTLMTSIRDRVNKDLDTITGRWLKAFGRPNSILDKASKVQGVIMEIRRLCEELLDMNVHMIKRLNLGKLLPEPTT